MSKNIVNNRRTTNATLNSPNETKGKALFSFCSIGPSFNMIDLPMRPQNPRKPTITPLISLGRFFEKYPSNPTL
jgi:hypothetical protein